MRARLLAICSDCFTQRKKTLFLSVTRFASLSDFTESARGTNAKVMPMPPIATLSNKGISKSDNTYRPISVTAVEYAI